MGRTLVEKILQKKIFSDAPPVDDYFPIQPDIVLGHDATIGILKERFDTDNIEFPVKNLFFCADHFSPPSSVAFASVLRDFLELVRSIKPGHFHPFQGISHRLLLESKLLLPFKVIFGADSHTVTAGALSAFGTGFGSTDILALLKFGFLYVKIPKTILIHLKGAIPWGITGIDIALSYLSILGESGAIGSVLEFIDEIDGGIPFYHRIPIANMSVEAGSDGGIFRFDRITENYLFNRDGTGFQESVLSSDEDAKFKDVIEIDCGNLEPLVAVPSSPSTGIPVRKLNGIRCDQVFIGSCAGGSLEEIEIAEKLIRKYGISELVRVIITPATERIFIEAINRGYIQSLMEKGVVVTNPSCGACGGIDKGILSDGEVCLATSNRNFQGRMGSIGSKLYLGSIYTAVATAITGKIADIREIKE